MRCMPIITPIWKMCDRSVPADKVFQPSFRFDPAIFSIGFMAASFQLSVRQFVPAFVVFAFSFIGIAERIAPRKTFSLNMTVFDEQLLVLKADVLVLFDPVFAGGADRIVDVENPDHFFSVSFNIFF